MSTSRIERLLAGTGALTMKGVVITRLLAATALLGYFVVSTAAQFASSCPGAPLSEVERGQCTHPEADVVAWLVAMAVLVCCCAWCRFVAWLGRRDLIVVWIAR